MAVKRSPMRSTLRAAATLLRTVRSTLRAASSRSVQRAAIAISDSSV
jgi:hypothetical protein